MSQGSLPQTVPSVGQLDQRTWDLIRAMSEFHSMRQQELDMALSNTDQDGSDIEWFLARITGNKRPYLEDPNDGNSVPRKWMYSWEKAEIDPTDETGASFRTPTYDSPDGVPLSSSVVTDGVEDKFANYAMNMCEDPNTRIMVGPGYGYVHIMPVGECEATLCEKQAKDASGTTETIFLNVVVLMYAVRDKQRKPRFYFYTHNAHSNACLYQEQVTIRKGSYWASSCGPD